MTIVAAASSRERTRRLPAGLVVGTATILTLVGIAIGLFFNPVWVSFEQGRTRADLWTGYTPETVRTVTDSVLAEVYLGPGTFAQSVDGTPVFNERERAHMANVRGVVVVFFGLVTRWPQPSWWSAGSDPVARPGTGAQLPVGRPSWPSVRWLLASRSRSPSSRRSPLFHDLFFAPGTWSFDPATDRLVQLFPDAFWTETSVAIAIAGLVLTARHLGVRATPRARGGLTC